jgi:hypothetical protein
MCVAIQNYQVPTVQAALAGTNLVLSGTGNASTPYSILSSTSLDLPTLYWSVVATQAFDLDGNFSWTNNVGAGTPVQFYRVMVP